ncbi:MAG: hypothetical protein HOJ25_03665 [Candidatus Magasanikbacteria bacterium]|jgi:hypothetical protein|nr:hypothetical protein [Candidatus Magasanikbacteria bacterium]
MLQTKTQRRTLMQRFTLFTLFFSLLITAFSCTENQRARSFGGKQEIALPTNTKLVSATWKNDSMYTLTRPMRSTERPETHTFKEYSSFGVLQGTVMIVESRD